MGFRGPSLFHQNEYISIYSLDELTIFSQCEVLDFGSCQENHYKFKLKHGALIGETKDHAISCQEACMLCLLVIDMLRKVGRKRVPAILSPHSPSKTTCPPSCALLITALVQDMSSEYILGRSNGFGKQL